MSALDLYRLRCGVVHQGRLAHPQFSYSRVLFTLPNRGNVFHRNIMNDALNLDLVRFCADMRHAVNAWYVAMEQDASVQNNLPRLVQFRALGLAPYIVGSPMIA